MSRLKKGDEKPAIRGSSPWRLRCWCEITHCQDSRQSPQGVQRQHLCSLFTDQWPRCWLSALIYGRLKWCQRFCDSQDAENSQVLIDEGTRSKPTDVAYRYDRRHWLQDELEDTPVKVVSDQVTVQRWEQATTVTTIVNQHPPNVSILNYEK